MNSKIGIIIRREYMERVTKKSFIVTTLLMPIVMFALMVTPTLIMLFVGTDEKEVLVVDQSGIIAPELKNTPELTFTACVQPLDSALSRDDVNAILYIPDGVTDGDKSLRLFTNGSSSLQLETSIASQINSIIETRRLEAYNIQGLDQILKDVHSDVTIISLRNDREEGDNQNSTILSYALGLFLSLLLYICLILYGQMVMTSIIEEKNNRVLEIVVSSVKPTQLMLGKILGICLVAVTQIIIWGVLISALVGAVLPAVLPATVSADLNAITTAGVDPTTLSTDVDLLQALSVIGNVGYVIGLFGWLLLFLVGGFLLYAAVYAAIGSAVDNIQDASQLQSIIIFPIIFGLVFGMVASSDPESQLAFWTSMIPFTSPMVMMSRIPFGIPTWEIIVSAVILYLSFFAMVWIAAKIYRVGIFMYGKKPSIKELIRWARYK